MKYSGEHILLLCKYYEWEKDTIVNLPLHDNRLRKLESEGKIYSFGQGNETMKSKITSSGKYLNLVRSLPVENSYGKKYCTTLH